MDGGLRAVGVGSGVTGYGTDLIVIDDPVRSRAEAESPKFRERMYDWFNDDLYTRLEPNGAMVLIQTRWHEDDLAGRLLTEMAETDGEQWEVVSLPALAEYEAESPGRRDGTESLLTDPLGRVPGEALCPERFDREHFERIRRQIGSYSFASLYQQRPVPAEGGIFKREWFTNIVAHAPPGLKWCRGYDLAVSRRTSADHTASFRCAYDKEGNLYIDGGFCRRIEFPEQRRYILGRVAAESDTNHGIEMALHGQAMMQELRRNARAQGRAIRGVKVIDDKVTRALIWAPIAEEGKLRLVKGNWNAAFIDEACSFPAGAHDDQIDAVSIAVQMHGERPGRLLRFGRYPLRLASLNGSAANIQKKSPPVWGRRASGKKHG